MAAFVPPPRTSLSFAGHELGQFVGCTAGGVVATLPHRGSDGRPRVIEILSPGIKGGLVAEFEASSRGGQKVQHPMLPAVYDTGADRGQRWRTMEWVRGPTLAEVRATAPELLGAGRQLDILLAIAVLLGSIRAAQTAPGSLAPERFVFDRSGTLRATSLPTEGLSAPPAPLDGVEWQTPERIRARRDDRRADVYALGLLGWWLHTGENPFARGGAALTVVTVLGGVPVRSPEGMDPKVSAVLRRAMAIDPAARPPSVAELAGMLTKAWPCPAQPASDGWRSGLVARFPAQRPAEPGGRDALRVKEMKEWLAAPRTSTAPEPARTGWRAAFSALRG